MYSVPAVKKVVRPKRPNLRPKQKRRDKNYETESKLLLTRPLFIETKIQTLLIGTDNGKKVVECNSLR